MDQNTKNIIFSVLIVLFTIVITLFLGKTCKNKEYDRTRFVARVGVFAALSTILYIVPVFQIQLPFLPPFLKLHFDEIPLFICGFAYGPLAGCVALVIKTIIKLPMTHTMCVGEIADLLFTLSFLLPATIIYDKKRNLKGVAYGFAVATICQLIVSVVLNIYAMLPFYMNVMEFPEAALLGLCQKANPAIKNLGWDYGLYAVLPLNAIKDAIVITVTFLVYRSIHVVLRFDRKPSKNKQNSVKKVEQSKK